MASVGVAELGKYQVRGRGREGWKKKAASLSTRGRFFLFFCRFHPRTCSALLDQRLPSGSRPFSLPSNAHRLRFSQVQTRGIECCFPSPGVEGSKRTWKAARGAGERMNRIRFFFSLLGRERATDDEKREANSSSSFFFSSPPLAAPLRSLNGSPAFKKKRFSSLRFFLFLFRFPLFSFIQFFY